eukprot:4707923-Amphidinium_carterae.2
MPSRPRNHRKFPRRMSSQPSRLLEIRVPGAQTSTASSSSQHGVPQVARSPGTENSTGSGRGKRRRTGSRPPAAPAETEVAPEREEPI